MEEGEGLLACFRKSKGAPASSAKKSDVSRDVADEEGCSRVPQDRREKNVGLA
jgi:hypothetical protein